MERLPTPLPLANSLIGMAESPEALEKTITALWEGRDDLFAVLPETEARAAVLQAVELLDTGEARVAEMVGGDVVVHEWLKFAVLLPA